MLPRRLPLRELNPGLDGAASDTIPSELSLELMLMEARVECRLI